MAFYSKFVQYYNSIFPFKNPTYEFLQSYIQPETRNVLDVGCGTGQYAARFSQEGYRAVGIDLDASMINFAKNHHSGAEFLALNMLDIEHLNQQFDFIFCIGNTAAHLSQKEFQSFVNSLSRVLRPGGIWIFQVINWDYITQQVKHTFPLLQSDDGKIQFRRTYTEISSKSLQFNTRLTDKGVIVFEDSVTMYPILSKDYIDIHQQSQFKLLGHFANFNRTPFDPDLESASVFVFQK